MLVAWPAGSQWRTRPLPVLTNPGGRMKRLLCLAEGTPGPAAVRLALRTAVALAAALLLGSAATASNASAGEFHPHLASQEVACNLVDKRIASIPNGDGVAPV